MKKSDLTAYLDAELSGEEIADVEETIVERQELIDELSELSRAKFLLAEYFAQGVETTSSTGIQPALAPIGEPASATSDQGETAVAEALPVDEGGFPKEPPPVEVERPRSVRSGPAPFVIAAVASLTALLVLNSLEIGGWTRSSRALAEKGFVMRYGQTKPIEKPRVLYFDDYLVTQEEAVPVLYSDTSTSITLGPWSRARFSADLNSKCIELVEGTLKVKINAPPPTPTPPVPKPPPKNKPKAKAKPNPKDKKEPAPKTAVPSSPKTDWKQLVIDTIEPWLHPRKVVHPYQLLVTSKAGTIEVPEKHTDTIEFTYSVIERTFNLDHRNGVVSLTPLEGDMRRIAGRQALRSIGDGKVQKLGQTKSRARVRLADARTDAILATCADLKPNETVGLTYRNARPILAEFTMGKTVTSVHFFLGYKAPGEDKFTDLSADTFRPKGKVTTNKAPYLFFGEIDGDAKKPSSWKPHNPGTYRLRAVPVLPKQSKPNFKEAIIIYLSYK